MRASEWDCDPQCEGERVRFLQDELAEVGRPQFRARLTDEEIIEVCRNWKSRKDRFVRRLLEEKERFISYWDKLRHRDCVDSALYVGECVCNFCSEIQRVQNKYVDYLNRREHQRVLLDRIWGHLQSMKNDIEGRRGRRQR